MAKAEIMLISGLYETRVNDASKRIKETGSAGQYVDSLFQNFRDRKAEFIATSTLSPSSREMLMRPLRRYFGDWRPLYKEWEEAEPRRTLSKPLPL